jgi:hypothetical protein
VFGSIGTYNIHSLFPMFHPLGLRWDPSGRYHRMIGGAENVRAARETLRETWTVDLWWGAGQRLTIHTVDGRNPENQFF